MPANHGHARHANLAIDLSVLSSRLGALEAGVIPSNWSAGHLRWALNSSSATVSNIRRLVSVARCSWFGTLVGRLGLVRPEYAAPPAVEFAIRILTVCRAHR